MPTTSPFIAGVIMVAIGTALTTIGIWGLVEDARHRREDADEGSGVPVAILPLGYGLAHLLPGLVCLAIGQSGTEVLVKGSTPAQSAGLRPTFAMTFAF